MAGGLADYDVQNDLTTLAWMIWNERHARQEAFKLGSVSRSYACRSNCLVQRFVESMSRRCVDVQDVRSKVEV
jgi:hypothetical protein